MQMSHLRLFTSDASTADAYVSPVKTYFPIVYEFLCTYLCALPRIFVVKKKKKIDVATWQKDNKGLTRRKTPKGYVLVATVEQCTEEKKKQERSSSSADKETMQYEVVTLSDLVEKKLTVKQRDLFFWLIRFKSVDKFLGYFEEEARTPSTVPSDYNVTIEYDSDVSENDGAEKIDKKKPRSKQREEEEEEEEEEEKEKEKETPFEVMSILFPSDPDALNNTLNISTWTMSTLKTQLLKMKEKGLKNFISKIKQRSSYKDQKVQELRNQIQCKTDNYHFEAEKVTYLFQYAFHSKERITAEMHIELLYK